METGIKANKGARLKAIDDAGSGVAVIATLNVVDHDGDVTLPGAFGKQTAKIVPAHNWQHVPLGKASIREEGNEVLADFQLNLDIQAAREWHASLKQDLADEYGNPLQEWSYGFAIEEAGFGEHEGRQVQFLKALKVHEISPVMLGAGINTRTVSVKDGGKFGGKLADQISKAASNVEAVAERCREVEAMRIADGQKGLSPDRYVELEELSKGIAELEKAAAAVRAALQNQAEPEEAELLFAEFLRVNTP